VQRDLNTLLGIVFVSALLVIAVNFIAISSMRASTRASRWTARMDAIKCYFRSPAAVAGLILLLIVIAMAISAGLLYPRDPLALAGRPLIWPFANPRFPLGTTIRAATSPRRFSTARGFRS